MNARRWTSPVVACAMLWGTRDAVAGDRSSAASVTLTPHVGVVAESEFVDGTIVFADGDVDFILIEPETGVAVGLEIAVPFRPTVRGVLAMSFATAEARYIEDGDFRPDAELDAIRVQPGAMVTLVRTAKLDVAVGGGLTVARYSLDRLTWNDRQIDASSTSLGVFGAAALDVPLARRLAFHAHLGLELNRSSYGDLEESLAAADGEIGAEVDHDTRTALMLAVGISFGL